MTNQVDLISALVWAVDAARTARAGAVEVPAPVVCEDCSTPDDLRDCGTHVLCGRCAEAGLCRECHTVLYEAAADLEADRLADASRDKD